MINPIAPSTQVSLSNIDSQSSAETAFSDVMRDLVHLGLPEHLAEAWAIAHQTWPTEPATMAELGDKLAKSEGISAPRDQGELERLMADLVGAVTVYAERASDGAPMLETILAPLSEAIPQSLADVPAGADRTNAVLQALIHSREAVESIGS